MTSVYTLDGLDPAKLRDAWIEDLKTGFPGFTTTEEKVGDKTVTRGGEGDGSGTWYAYIAGDKLFIIDSGDDDVARRILGALSDGPAGVRGAAGGDADPDSVGRRFGGREPHLSLSLRGEPLPPR